MSRSRGCLVLGSINIDEIYEVPHIVRQGETLSSSNFVRGSGGKGGNCAVAIAQAGGQVDFAGFIGPDGQFLKDQLHSFGVGVTHLKQVDTPTGRAVIQVTTEKEADNCIILFKGANHNPVSALPDLCPYQVLVLQNEIPLRHTISALEAADRLKVAAVFNPSPMLTPTEAKQFPWPKLTWLVINKDELSMLSEVLIMRTQGDAVKDIVALGRHLDAKVSIVVTLGKAGAIALLAGDSSVIEVPAGRLEGPVVDTTGAGDTCTGYFVAEICRARAQVSRNVCMKMLQISQQAATMSVEVKGAMASIPKRPAVEERLATMSRASSC